MATADKNRTLSEVIGLVLVGTGALLFLALISYEPKDVPEWFVLNRISPANHPVHNFIGPLGAIIASIFYFLLGAAAYFVAAILLGCGAAKLVAGSFRLTRRLGWITLFILSGACLLQLYPRIFDSWSRLNIRGAGGWMGYFVGHSLLERSLGTIGATIVLLSAYLVSLIQVTGLQPIMLMRRAFALPGIWSEKYAQFRLGRADERQRLVLEEKRVAREAKKLERLVNKKGVPAQTVSLETLEDEIERPEPQVIDTSAPRPVDADAVKAAIEPKSPQHFEDYQLPSLDLLDEPDFAGRQAADPEELRKIQATLIETLGQFGISVDAGDITKGPTITRYEVYPAKGVRVDKIVSLERDLARATRAERINILAPIPGKDTVGIEIANSRKVKVTLRELLESDDWRDSKFKIPLALGKDVYGKTILADLAQMPHLLVAGTTGSGKSVCINAIIASMLYRFSPEEIRFIMIDPKVVEMQIYERLPHLVVPVVTDPKKVLLALRWVIDEMEKRYKIFAKSGMRNITSFNARPKPKSHAELDLEREEAESVEENGAVFNALTQPPIVVPRDDDLIVPDRMPYIVVIIDELADLMQTAPADVENAIARITQMARAAGIHMIVATQTPRADVVTGIIKANIPSRIAFQVASKLDSRVILDENGADRLLGQGDMLYLPPGTSRMTRAQGVLVTDDEIRDIVDFVRTQAEPEFETAIHDKLSATGAVTDDVTDEDEELVEKCIEIMRQEKKASTSLFQRRLRLGYTRAARVVDILEQRGYVAAGEGAKPREILKDLDALVH
ncbi:MAG: DNA translocase FtsK [Verrucomicrobiota bacterium]|nr:DNA translocase FtsK [Verrucomicrobiota bacterium]